MKSRRKGEAQQMKLIAIAVVASNGVIGDGNDQPFKFAEDWARFKKITMGHSMIMGRKTHEAMGLLPGRTSIVITHHPEKLSFPVSEDGRPRGIAVTSWEQAVQVPTGDADDVRYVIGGGQIYRLAWPHLDELDITEVHAQAVGSVLFPEIKPEEWKEGSRQPRGEFDFVRYTRAQ